MSCGKCETPVEGELIGKITHYFDKVGVAVIGLSGILSVGDEVKIVGGEADFIQKVGSMEVEHQKIEKAKKGDSVGIKVDQKVKDGCKVYKI